MREKLLPAPLVYLSAYFEHDRDAYYNQLLRVSATGDWESWLRYFLTGVAQQAHDALLRSRRMQTLREELRHVLQERRESGNALRLLDELFVNPYMTAPSAAKLLGVTTAGARGILDRLAEAGVVEYYGGEWPRLYILRDLLDILEAPTATG